MQVSEVGTNVASMQSSSYTQSGEAQPRTQTEKVQVEIDRAIETREVREQKEELNELAKQLNKELNPLNTNVTFSFNDDIDGLYVTVSEKNTNRVIRKIPSDEAMALMAKMKEVVGMIFDKQA